MRIFVKLFRYFMLNYHSSYLSQIWMNTFVLDKYVPVWLSNGLPWWLSGKETVTEGDKSLAPGLGRSPWGGNGTHSSILAWEIPWTEEPGGVHGVTKSRTRLSMGTSDILCLLIRQEIFHFSPESRDQGINGVTAPWNLVSVQWERARGI